MNKPALRKELRRLGRLLPREERAARSLSITSQLRVLLGELRPQRIALYMAMADEPDLSLLIDELTGHCEVYLPRVRSAEEIDFALYQGDGNSLTRVGDFALLEPSGDLEPVAPSELDVIVVPAMAYDHRGYRLGRGRGYYDRYLGSTRAYTIGVTLDIAPEVSWEVDHWDVPMDAVLRPL